MTNPVAKAFTYRLDELTPDEMRVGMEALEKELQIGTDWTGDSTGRIKTTEIVAALDRAPNNYLAASRILAAVRREHTRITTRIEKDRAAIKHSARAVLNDAGIKSPIQSLVTETARRRFSKWTTLAEEEADIQAALDLAESMARAWRDREASLRKMIDSGY
jgi:hypothetical protein